MLAAARRKTSRRWLPSEILGRRGRYGKLSVFYSSRVRANGNPSVISRTTLSKLEAAFLSQRRARDSNPQPLAGRRISNQMPLALIPRGNGTFPRARGQMRGQPKRNTRTMMPTCRPSWTLGRPWPMPSRPASWRWSGRLASDCSANFLA